MTVTGFFVGILAGIGVLALAMVGFLVIAVRKMKEHTDIAGGAKYADGHNGPRGFGCFTDFVREKLDDAPVGSNIRATLPLPAVDLYLQVAGRRAGTTSYRLELRMGYRRFDHLDLVQRELAQHDIGFERIDKDNGAIKLRSDKTEDIDQLLKIGKGLKKAVMYDLSDKSIQVTQNLRSAS